jgi:dynein intermediate chain 1
MAVYAVKFNPFNGNYFLSVSADWTVKLWDLNEAEPIMTYDLNGSVGDVAWSPYSSAVFAAVNAEGKLFIFDLSQNKYAPVCEQQIVKKAKLTHLSFSNNEPIILVGDDRGTIVSVKLPPTLRKEIEKEEQAPRLTAIINAAQGKPAY